MAKDSRLLMDFRLTIDENRSLLGSYVPKRLFVPLA